MTKNQNANVTTRTTHPEHISMKSQASGTFIEAAQDLMTAVVGDTEADRMYPRGNANKILRRIVKKAGFANYDDKKTKIQVCNVDLDVLNRTVTLVVTLINTVDLPRAKRTEVVTTRASLLLNFKG